MEQVGKSVLEEVASEQGREGWMCGLQVKMQNVQTRGNANEGIKVSKMKTKVHRQFLKSFLVG